MKSSGCFTIGCGSLLFLFLLSAIISSAEVRTILFWIFALVMLVGLIWYFHRRSKSKNDDQSVETRITSSKSNPSVEGYIDLEDEYGIEEYEHPEVQWYGPGSNVTIAGRNIGAMIYLGDSTGPTYWHRHGGVFVDPNLETDEYDRDVIGELLPYWPDYNNVSPTSRATYLDWLATGRSNKDYNPGYVFLYFYGLEYRFFQDSRVCHGFCVTDCFM